MRAVSKRKLNLGKHLFALNRLGWEFAGTFPRDGVSDTIREFNRSGLGVRISELSVSPDGTERPAYMVDLFTREASKRVTLSDGEVTNPKTYAEHHLGVNRDELGCYHPLTAVGYRWQTNVLQKHRIPEVVSELERKGYQVKVNDIAVDNEGTILAEGKVAIFVRTPEDAEKHNLANRDKEIVRFSNGQPMTLEQAMDTLVIPHLSEYD
ncbi:MAG: hypothetical protein KKB31_06810 [Nanoarchaeota archaeon]|nr:hypothetical protein [Nanoarchaeota archaeon]